MRMVATRWNARIRRDGPNADTMTPPWKAVLLADPCVFCGAPPNQLDHIHPRSRGGKNGWTNIAPICAPCNGMKSNGLLWWMLWRRDQKRRGLTRERVIKRSRVRVNTQLGGHRWVLQTETMTEYRLLRRRKVKAIELHHAADAVARSAGDSDDGPRA